MKYYETFLYVAGSHRAGSKRHHIYEVFRNARMAYRLPGNAGGVMLAAMACSYFCLSKAVKKIPISVAYAVWEGLGLAGTALMAWLIFND